eukprot:TRINITY_DN27090_c0_g1_i1.p1 TRINITY_DN27090_c0_g1~~TRINITY_DN27090_c0_g1_i1.p1  ORF type:complete len:373 (+),score=91.96 TRINITY_DN27090_c0_g1_i1:77-1120(+)
MSLSSDCCGKVEGVREWGDYSAAARMLRSSEVAWEAPAAAADAPGVSGRAYIFAPAGGDPTGAYVAWLPVSLVFCVRPDVLPADVRKSTSGIDELPPTPSATDGGDWKPPPEWSQAWALPLPEVAALQAVKPPRRFSVTVPGRSGAAVQWQHTAVLATNPGGLPRRWEVVVDPAGMECDGLRRITKLPKDRATLAAASPLGEDGGDVAAPEASIPPGGAPIAVGQRVLSVGGKVVGSPQELAAALRSLVVTPTVLELENGPPAYGPLHFTEKGAGLRFLSAVSGMRPMPRHPDDAGLCVAASLRGDPRWLPGGPGEGAVECPRWPAVVQEHQRAYPQWGEAQNAAAE